MERIGRADIEANFGSVENFDAKIAEFSAAVEAHKTTENVPAPTAHGIIEWLVKQHGGKYQLVEPQAVAEPVAPRLTERRDALLASAAHLRWTAEENGAVLWNNRMISTARASLAGLFAAWFIWPPLDREWRMNYKLTSGEFVELMRDDLWSIIVLIRGRVQQLFDNEKDFAERVNAAKSHKALDALDINDVIAGE